MTHDQDTFHMWIMNILGEYKVFVSKLFNNGIEHPKRQALEWLNDVMYRGV